MDKESQRQSDETIRNALSRLVRAAKDAAPPAGPPRDAPRTPAPPDPVPAGPVRKVPVSIRLDADLVAALRATGRGWQSRANATLRAAMRLRSGATEHLSGNPQKHHGAEHGDDQRAEEGRGGREPHETE